jgi:hypothetical protein
VFEVEPNIELWVPAGHCMQIELPLLGLYVPARQMLQSACDTLPWLAVVMPGGQPVQGMPPEAFLYMPTGQGVHDDFPCSALNVPLGQELHCELLADEKLPAGQGLQDVFEVEPNIELWVPAGHCMQIELPLLGLYVPTRQARHAPLEKLPVKAL